MSKLSKAIYEIHHMDTLANQNQWMNRIHPLVKFVLTVFYIGTVVSFPKYDMAGLAGMMVYPLVVFIIGDLSFLDSIYRLRIVLPLVCFVGLFNPFFDRVPVGTLGSFTITAGMISMVTLMLKGILTVLASYILIATTTIEKLCYALRLLHVPAFFVTQLMLTYRYVSVLLAEANRIMQAYSLRAPNQKGVHFKVWGSLTGQLLLRSMDRAGEVYESMCLRGYTGEYHFGDAIHARGKDYLYLLFWCCIFALFRLLPVLNLIGGLFVA
ncbi:MAG: cobalt ECF transporter T component CbiQ [Lachnospiraceae bacterium]|nr:cobalt ECF transporter T component CbiQ [Lachnospiraceae bacterium]